MERDKRSAKFMIRNLYLFCPIGSRFAFLLKTADCEAKLADAVCDTKLEEADCEAKLEDSDGDPKPPPTLDPLEDKLVIRCSI